MQITIICPIIARESTITCRRGNPSIHVELKTTRLSVRVIGDLEENLCMYNGDKCSVGSRSREILVTVYLPACPFLLTERAL